MEGFLIITQFKIIYSYSLKLLSHNRFSSLSSLRNIGGMALASLVHAIERKNSRCNNYYNRLVYCSDVSYNSLL